MIATGAESTVGEYRMVASVHGGGEGDNLGDSTNLRPLPLTSEEETEWPPMNPMAIVSARLLR